MRRDYNDDGSVVMGVLNCFAFYMALYVVYELATFAKYLVS